MEEEKIHQILETLYLSPSKPSSLGGIDRLFKEAKNSGSETGSSKGVSTDAVRVHTTQTGKEKVQKKKSDSG